LRFLTNQVVVTPRSCIDEPKAASCCDLGRIEGNWQSTMSEDVSDDAQFIEIRVCPPSKNSKRVRENTFGIEATDRRVSITAWQKKLVPLGLGYILKVRGNCLLK